MKTKLFLTVSAVLLVSASSFSQCRSFVKNNCGDAMGEYIPGENFNAARLHPGDMAEIGMTFYADEDYRLLICSHPMLGQVNWQLMDSEKNVLFDNTEHGNTDFFDFTLEGTQEMLVKINVSEENTSALNPQGCVTIMQGKKMEKSPADQFSEIKQGVN